MILIPNTWENKNAPNHQPNHIIKDQCVLCMSYSPSEGHSSPLERKLRLHCSAATESSLTSCPKLDESLPNAGSSAFFRYPLVNYHITNWKITIFSIGPFSIAILVITSTMKIHERLRKFASCSRPKKKFRENGDVASDQQWEMASSNSYPIISHIHPCSDVKGLKVPFWMTYLPITSCFHSGHQLRWKLLQHSHDQLICHDGWGSVPLCSSSILPSGNDRHTVCFTWSHGVEKNMRWDDVSDLSPVIDLHRTGGS